MKKSPKLSLNQRLTKVRLDALELDRQRQAERDTRESKALLQPSPRMPRRPQFDTGTVEVLMSKPDPDSKPRTVFVEVVSEEDFEAQQVREAIAALKSWSSRYGMIKPLAKVTRMIDKIIEKHEEGGAK